MKNISVIIPSLNPDARLGGVVQGVLDKGFVDVILVDDGSDTENKKFFPKGENITLLVHEQNRGKGAALKTALDYVMKNRPDSQGVVTCDGDGQHTADDTLRVAEEMKRTGKFVLGVRDFSLDNVPARSRIGNRLSSAALFICSGTYISDTQTGLRAIPPHLFKPMAKISGDRFEYETNVLLELGNMKAHHVEVKIETVYLEENKSSHFRPFRDTLRIFSLMLKYLASSALSFIIDVAVFGILNGLFKCGVILSTVSARLISSIFNFTLNKKVVFKSRTPVVKALLKYYLLVIPVMLISALSTKGLSILFGAPDNSFGVTIIKIAVDTILYIINFQIQKRWIFKDKN